MQVGMNRRRWTITAIRLLRPTCAWLACLATVGGSLMLNIASSPASATSPSGWQVVAQLATGNSHLMGISCPSVDDCFAAGGVGLLEATTDGGTNWVS
jgi:hypothetical protein